MEKKFRHYSIEGLELDVPLRRRKGSSEYSENHHDLIDHPQFTPSGHPVILSWDWVCQHFAKRLTCQEENIRNWECSDCQYFVRAEAEQPTFIGICTREEKKRNQRFEKEDTP